MKWTALLFVLFVPMAVAAKDDLVNCRYDTGQSIPPKLCQSFRRHQEQYAADLAKKEADRAAAVEREREYQAKRQAQMEEQQRQAAERREKEAADQRARKEEWDRRRAEEERQEKIVAAEERREAKVAADKKKAKMAECGEDYGTPRIGMTLERANRCVGTFKLVSQINRADGVVSTYRAGRIGIHVMGGKIAAWDRY